MDDLDERIRLNEIKMKEFIHVASRISCETLTLDQLREQVKLNRELSDNHILPMLESVLARREAVEAEIEEARARLQELQPVNEEFQALMMEKIIREQMAEGKKRKEEQDREYKAALAAEQARNTPPVTPKLTEAEQLRKENERLRYELYCATHHQCGCKMGPGETRQYECNDCHWHNND